MAHTTIPPPRGTTDTLKLTHKGNINDKTIPERDSLLIVKVGLGISRSHADSQWNPVYDAFHRIFCCANETICQQFFKRDLDVANMRPALEQGCGEQTPSAT